MEELIIKMILAIIAAVMAFGSWIIQKKWNKLDSLSEKVSDLDKRTTVTENNVNNIANSMIILQDIQTKLEKMGIKISVIEEKLNEMDRHRNQTEAKLEQIKERQNNKNGE